MMKMVYSRRRSLPEGSILLEDGKKVCESVTCTSGALVKDIIDQVCIKAQDHLQIVPIARHFFALCDHKTALPLSPYHILSTEEAKKKYQLRVFVNTGDNSFQLLRMSKAAYKYYYCQLKEEFVSDRLYPRASVNTGIWMAAIDMAREAHGTESDYTDIIRNPKDLLKFMPKFLKDKCTKKHDVDEKLRDTFRRFKDIRKSVELEHYESKYVEVFEKDMMCGKHIFRLKPDEATPRRRSQPLLVVVSCKEGIYKVHMGESKGTKLEVCSIISLSEVAVNTTSIKLTVKVEDSSEQETEEITLSFFDKKEAQSFAVIVHAYYQLLVNANEVILTGTLAPNQEFLRVGCNPDDGKKAELCHAPIPPQIVSSTLSNHGAADSLSNGNFLIRESRNTDHAYTLSVWYQSKVMNYRIMYKESEGYSFQDPQTEEGEPGPFHQIFPTLQDLVNHHSQAADGLPAVLKMNYSPKITGPIPLLKLADLKSTSSGSLTLNSQNGLSSDEDSSSTSTPTTATPFSLGPTTPNPFLTDITAVPPTPAPQTSIPQTPNEMSSPQTPNEMSSPQTPNEISSPRTPNEVSSPQTPNEVSSPQTPNEVSSPRTPSLDKPTSPFISDLIAKGVRYIKYGDLTTLKELGSGHYSTVYLAEWAGENCKVAAKIPTMKEHNVEAVKKDLMREILTMSALEHPHIIKLLGISDTRHYLDYIGVIPVVVMEFVGGGCLRTFLNNMKRAHSDHSKTKRDFVLYGKQIAEGMDYLARSKIVHRDLAARNVLLVSSEQVKISDFGLARKQLENSDYYTPKGASSDLPIYWYAPECLSTFKFSTKGDVWSYGVTLWEMFTLGDNPNTYLGQFVRQASNVQMAFQMLVKGIQQQRLPLPSMNCEKSVYNSILVRCWELDPHKRPTFETLAKDMGELYGKVMAAAKNAESAASHGVSYPSNPSPAPHSPASAS